jgi:membrane protease YdiL (CAAX protease family)
MTEGFAAKQDYWLRVLAIIGVSLFGFIFIGPIVGFFLALPFYEGSLFSFMDDMISPFGNDNMRVVLYIVQAGATFVGLTLVPAFYWWRTTRTSLITFVDKPRISWMDAGLVIAIVIVFMGFNSVFIEWNANVDIPDVAGGFERWARDTEDKAMELTKFLTEFSTFGQFVLGFIVIAVLASIGEEFVFRGLLQPALHKATGNIHVAIWVAALLFSTLHMQFYGFVPRVLLGALFGYLYFWSGNLLIPMLAHLVNNGFSVLMIYVNQKELVGIDLEKPQAAPGLVVLTCTILTALLLYYFRKINYAKVHAT